MKSLMPFSLKRTALITVLLFRLFLVQAQVPSGYYNNAEGKTGATLKTALYNIIKGHTDLGYGGLYTTYETSDNIVINGNDCVYDMYSIRANGTADYFFAHGNDQCGSYSSEGDCYNREHSMPQSWFKEHSPMKNDAHHVIPSDGKVNGMRSNFPHAEVGSASFTSTNGSKLGTCSTAGYSGKVFEPIDEFKGDFARMYLYMATRYEDQIGSWAGNGTASTVLAGNSYPVYKTWYVALLLKWHEEDPVSTKEIQRNNAIYARQHNRNPFIDRPEFAEMIWGSTPSNPLSFTSTAITSASVGVAYNYNITAQSTQSGATLTITAPTKPNWLTLSSIGNGTSKLSGTPTTAGSFNVILQVSDGTNTKQQSFAISVVEAPATVIFTSTPVTSGTVATAYSYSVSASSTIAAEANITAIEKPDWLTLTAGSNGTATLNGTPTADNIGDNDVTLKASNGTDEVEQSFVITIADTASAGSGAMFTETFENIPANSSSYSNIEWIGDNDFEWTATKARTDQTIDNRAICLKDVSSTYLQSQTLTGGCSMVGFTYQQAFSGSGGQITIYVNDTEIETVDVTTEVQIDSFAVSVSGDYVIKLASNGSARIVIDNLFWRQQGSSVQNQKPSISEVNVDPEAPQVNQPIAVSATITDSDGSIASAQLLWGTTQNNLTNTLNMSVNGSIYSAVIPAQTEAGTMYFRILATDNLGLTNVINQSVQILPTYSPEISNVAYSPQNPTNTETVAVTATVTDADGDLGAVKLYWGLAQNSMSNVLTMTANASTYAATIPAQEANSTVNFKVVAVDAEGNETASDMSSYTVLLNNSNPEVSNVSYTPENPNQNSSVLVKADVADSDGNLYEVKLFWGLQNDNITNMEYMEPGNGLQHSATIPAQAANSSVYFRIIAVDVAGGTDTSEVFSYTVSFENAVDNNLFVGLKIYPNPTSGILAITSAELEITKVELFSSLGVCIYSSSPYSSSLKIDISNSPKGVYLLRLWSDEKMSVLRVIKE